MPSLLLGRSWVFMFGGEEILQPRPVRLVPPLHEVRVNGQCHQRRGVPELTGERGARVAQAMRLIRRSSARRTAGRNTRFIQPGALKWLQGEEQLRAFKVPEAKRFNNQFCAICGARVAASVVFSLNLRPPGLQPPRIRSAPFTRTSGWPSATGIATAASRSPRLPPRR